MKNSHALALSAALLASLALAGEPGKPRTPPENEPPANSDNNSDNSAAAHVSERAQLPEFSSLDADGDTTISRKEARGHAGLKAIFAECDADQNGALNAWEFAEARNRLEK